MNILLMGFSTTGKSSRLRELKNEISQDIKPIDSDWEISRGYNHHIYGLFIDKHKNEDPETRREIMDEISFNENLFLKDLRQISGAYVAALGPNIHIRNNWNEYYTTTNPFVIFLKADVESVYQGLIKREEDLHAEFGDNHAFGNWNQGVIRKYNPKTKRYERLPERISKENIANLINVNEGYYSKIANSIFDADTLFEWHENFDLNKKRELIEIVKTNIG